MVHLPSLRIEPFTYETADHGDDFRAVVDQMIHHRHIVFVTPVYWYAMSGLMKTLFDRFTDLLVTPSNRKTGRLLAGKDVWLLATGTDDALPPGFLEPFARTAAYFGMCWKSAFYVRIDKNLTSERQNFAEVEKLATALLPS